MSLLCRNGCHKAWSLEASTLLMCLPLMVLLTPLQNCLLPILLIHDTLLLLLHDILLPILHITLLPTLLNTLLPTLHDPLLPIHHNSLLQILLFPPEYFNRSSPSIHCQIMTFPPALVLPPLVPQQPPPLPPAILPPIWTPTIILVPLLYGNGCIVRK